MRLPGAGVTLVWGPPVHGEDGRGSPWSCRLYGLGPEVAIVEEVGTLEAPNRAMLHLGRAFGLLVTAAEFYRWRLAGSPPPEDDDP